MQQETIILKSYELLKHLIAVLKKMPRDQKFLLGDRMQNMASDCMELLIEAYYVPRDRKAPLLSTVNIRLEKLRYYVRLCYDSGYYSSLKMKELNEKIDEIGRMTGGWLKSLK